MDKNTEALKREFEILRNQFYEFEGVSRAIRERLIKIGNIINPPLDPNYCSYCGVTYSSESGGNTSSSCVSSASN